MLLTETWLSEEDYFSITGFDVIRNDRINQRGGRVAILVKRKLKYTVLTDIFDINQEIEVCGVEVTLNGSP